MGWPELNFVLMGKKSIFDREKKKNFCAVPQQALSLGCGAIQFNSTENAMRCFCCVTFVL